MPIWSPDGTRILFGSQRNGQWGSIERHRTARDEELLLESEVLKTPMDSTPDGARSSTGQRTTPNLWVLPLDGERQPGRCSNLASGRAIRRSHRTAMGRFSRTSPANARSTSHLFRAARPIGRVSTNGGTYARWRADGKEVYYLSATSRGDLMAVAVDDSGSALELGAPQRLFPPAT